MPELGELSDIAMLLDSRFGLAFPEDRMTVLRRAVSARLPVVGLANPLEYARLLNQDETELWQLADHATNNLSRFFRNPEQLAAIVGHARAVRSETVRIWVAGCGNGMEPYTLALALLAEGLDIDVTATDISSRVLEIAAAGRYPLRHLNRIPARCHRYLDLSKNRVTVSRSVRRRITFLKHSVTENAPVHDVDLVLCRNVLTYLTPGGIKRALRQMEAASACDGLLAVGASESLPRRRVFKLLKPARLRLYRRSCPTADAGLPSDHGTPPHP